MKIVFKVWGAEKGASGELHRQRESFGASNTYKDFTILRADVTGTNFFVIVIYSGDENPRDWIDGQVSDGIFENDRVGLIEAYKEKENGFFEKIKLNDL